jgi:ABC-type lipoprotein export system ATPase subunit
MELLRELTKRKGNGVVVSHDERLRAVAGRVLWLHDGRLREHAKAVRRMAAAASPVS